MSTPLKYALLAAAILFVGYNSIYIRKLSDVRNAEKALDFDAKAYAENFLHTTLPAHPEKAIDLPQLARTLISDPAKAFSWSHAQNNGNNRFFLVKGAGKITKIDSEYVTLAVEGVRQKVALATRYIIGTAARDGSGLISVDEFTTTMDMNTVSEELNKLIRNQVLPPFKAAAKPGDNIEFTGGLELQQNAAVPDFWEITPMILTIR
jgi:predicted lipoprotein